MMDAASLFHRRFSCRNFLAAPLREHELTAILEAGRWAPSAGNLQPWRFVVVSSGGLRRQLALAAAQQHFVAEAPVVIVVCAVTEESARIYGDRGRSLYCLQDTAAAVENILLAATAMGLGSCWVGAFDEPAVAAILELPAGWRPVAIVPLGHPSQEPSRPGRRPFIEVVLER